MTQPRRGGSQGSVVWLQCHGTVTLPLVLCRHCTRRWSCGKPEPPERPPVYWRSNGDRTWAGEVRNYIRTNGKLGHHHILTANEGVNQLELVGFDSCRTDLIIIKTTPPVQLKDVALGLKYLHSQLVIHGDLKGVRLSNSILSLVHTQCNSRSQLNILINKDRHACLADFGLT